ncbi:MAG: abortive infection family protein [Microbacteriaceae bacterium]
MTIERVKRAAIGASEERRTRKSLARRRQVVGHQLDRDLPELFDLVADTLGLPTKTTAGSTSGGVRAIVRGLATTVEGVTRVRNDVGTGHAHTEARADTLHARLVFNATVTICEFLAVEWQRQDSAS